jgi:hypothetical protein
MTAERAELERIWQQRLERAAIAADRARRCYRLAEPENRLVVRQLEADWEAALAAQQRLQEDYDRFTRTRPQPLTPVQQQAIAALASDIEGLWAAPTTTDADRKQIIRTVVEQVTITVVATSEHVAVTIGWAGGHTTRGQTIRPVARLEQLSCYPQLVERVRQLAEQGHRARAIARRLHAEGFRPAKGRQRIGISAITQLLHQLGCPRAFTRQRIIPPPGEEPGPHEWWLDDLAAELAMPPSPCTAGSAAAGVTPARSPAAPTGGSSTPTRPARRASPAPVPPAWLVHPSALGRLRATSPHREPRSCSQFAYMSALWLTHLHPPARPSDPHQGDQRQAGWAGAQVVGQLPGAQAAAQQQPAPHPSGASAVLSARRLQAYQRRPLAPALRRSQPAGGICSASRAADAGGPDAGGSGSVHLTASTWGSWRVSSQPRSVGLPP